MFSSNKYNTLPINQKSENSNFSPNPSVSGTNGVQDDAKYVPNFLFGGPQSMRRSFATPTQSNSAGFLFRIQNYFKFNIVFSNWIPRNFKSERCYCKSRPEVCSLVLILSAGTVQISRHTIQWWRRLFFQTQLG